MLVNVVASIVKRTRVNDFCSLYTTVKTTTGHYDDKLKVFYEANGDAYLDVITSFSSRGEFAYDNLVETDDLSKRVCLPNHTLYDVIDEYCEECSDYAILAVEDRNNLGNVSTIYIDTKNLVELAKEFGYTNIDEQISIIDALCRRFQFCDSFDKKLEEFCDMAFAEDVSVDKLERSKKIVNYFLNRLETVLDILNSEIKLNEAYSQDITASEKITFSTNGTETEPLDDFDVVEVFNYVKGNVVGQDDAVYRLIIEIARAFDSGRDKDGILITGDSGVGKTLTLTSLAECLNRPLLIIDSTQLTIPGYTGKNIEEYLYDLYVKTGGNKSLTENAIIYFDEIDKKGSAKKSDVSGQGVLNVMLKFLDGTTYDAKDSMYSPTNVVKISTSNMLVIAGGAFRDVYNNKSHRAIGFGEDSSLEKIEPSCEDFIERGMMTKEFMGRFPIVIHFDPLDKKALYDVLTTSNKSPLKREEKTFGNAGVRLKVTPAYLEAVTQSALKLDTGARGLKRIVSDTTWRPYAEVKTNDSYGEVILDADTVSNNKVYRLIKKDNSN